MIQAAKKYSAPLVDVLEKLKNHEQVDINEPTGLLKNTPLQLAASIPDKVGADMVQLFLYKGADPSLLGPFTKQQPLYKAAEQGNVAMVKVLIVAMQEKGYNLDFANVYSKDDSLKRTAYQQAASQHAASGSQKTAYKEIMDLLEAAKANTTL
jgi:ankyrin repeat protein